MYFLCPISIVRYDYTDLLVSSIPQAMFFFDFFVVFLVGFRCFFSRHVPPSMCERPKKSRSAPKWPYVFPFSGGKNVPKKRKKLGLFFCPPRHYSGLTPDSPRPSRRPPDRTWPPFPTFLPTAAAKPSCAPHQKYLYSQNKSQTKYHNNPKIFPKFTFFRTNNSHYVSVGILSKPWLELSNEPNFSVVRISIGEVRSAPQSGLHLWDRGSTHAQVYVRLRRDEKVLFVMNNSNDCLINTHGNNSSWLVWQQQLARGNSNGTRTVI